MNDLIKWLLIGLLSLGIISGMVYKATHPTPYKHPLYQKK